MLIKKNTLLVKVSFVFGRLLQQRYQLICNQCSPHIETKQFICIANQLISFFTKGNCLQKS